MRTACWGCVAVVAALTWAAPANASKVLVLGKDGQVRVREDRWLPKSTDLPAPRARVSSRRPAAAGAQRKPRRAAVAVSTRRKRKRRTVVRELRRLQRQGAIPAEDYASRRAIYEDARRRARRLRGTRGIEMRAVLRTLDDMAARRQLTQSRLIPLWLTLERNLEWWTEGSLLRSGQRIEFEGSELVWQYYPGQGVQLQMLGNFGKLNGLWGARRQDDQLAVMLDELLPLAAERAGGVAWEYYFNFGGGRPPWASGLAQGTAVQALARAAVRLDRQADVLPIAQRALNLFEAPTPTGVRVPAEDGNHYAIYSFAPDLRVLNGFIQALNGLYDYARLAGDPRATTLFQSGEAQARREVPTYDTGAWSLYSRGSITRESDVSYHDLLQDFLAGLCRRMDTEPYCSTADRFVEYKSEPPVVDVRERRLRGGRAGRVRFSLSKISAVTLTIRRGGRVVESRPFGNVGYGKRTFGWDVPRRAGRYTVELFARDLTGNSASDEATIQVLRPKRS
jgi:D-glucuronyl C5-epimerase-like protein